MWEKMSEDERKSFIDKQWDDFFNMDAGTRKAMVGQMVQMSASMQQKMQAMSPEQRSFLINEIKSAMPPQPNPGGKTP
jgi:hypothetical protein